MTTQLTQPIIAALQGGDAAEAVRLSRNHLLKQPHDEALLVLLALGLQ
jgi:hypothetical protein